MKLVHLFGCESSIDSFHWENWEAPISIQWLRASRKHKRHASVVSWTIRNREAVIGLECPIYELLVQWILFLHFCEQAVHLAVRTSRFWSWCIAGTISNVCLLWFSSIEARLCFIWIICMVCPDGEQYGFPRPRKELFAYRIDDYGMSIDGWSLISRSFRANYCWLCQWECAENKYLGLT